ncbi:MAG: aldo/keto reductase [Betaproteobacteria bacterium]|nr:aldo/keto reductase [Betaproteobacteria bacterium]
MRYRKFGAPGIELSEIAFGTGDNAGGMVFGTAKEQVKLVERALESGINLFDTSCEYGKASAEVNLGRTLQEVGAKDVFVITKVKPKAENLGRLGAAVRDSLHDSLFRLRRDHVDFLMLHNPCRAQRDPASRRWNPLTPRDVIEEVLPALQDLQAAGKTRFIGMACDYAEAPAVIEAIETRAFSLIHATYNLVNPTAVIDVAGVPRIESYQGLLFGAAARTGTRVAVIRPLGGGALVTEVLRRGLEALHPLARGWFRNTPESQTAIGRAGRFLFLDRPGEQTLSEAAYRFALDHPLVISAIGGFSDPRHMDEAARASDAGPLSSSDREAITAEFSKGF